MQNTSLEQFTYRYNIKILSGNGATLKTNPVEGGVALDTIPLKGISFSNGAFVGSSLLVNELFNNRYRIREFDDDLKEIDAIELFHSTKALLSLPRIELTSVH